MNKTDIKKRIKELDKKISSVYGKAKPFQDERNKLRNSIALEEAEKLRGKCFHFKNSDGTNDWDGYVKILCPDKEEGLLALEFQFRPKNEITVHLNRNYYPASFENTNFYKPIKLEEFEEAYDILLEKLSRYSPNAQFSVLTDDDIKEMEDEFDEPLSN